ncbi:hypothetical protein BaRGS_00007784 [Batillaria attramentaria]|uniref:Uncharacterized protein n=1 Tax=Batillaria attramentaria TaxID=370345 RepID=A0ABD0LPF5_9CAEN
MHLRPPQYRSHDRDYYLKRVDICWMIFSHSGAGQTMAMSRPVTVKNVRPNHYWPVISRWTAKSRRVPARATNIYHQPARRPPPCFNTVCISEGKLSSEGVTA